LSDPTGRRTFRRLAGDESREQPGEAVSRCRCEGLRLADPDPFEVRSPTSLRQTPSAPGSGGRARTHCRPRRDDLHRRDRKDSHTASEAVFLAYDSGAEKHPLETAARADPGLADARPKTRLADPVLHLRIGDEEQAPHIVRRRCPDNLLSGVAQRVLSDYRSDSAAKATASALEETRRWRVVLDAIRGAGVVATTARW